jgi:WD40 repeat protein
LARGGRPQDYLGHSDRSIRVYDWETGREILRLEPLDTATACLRFSRDGKYLISGMYDGTTLLWDLDGAWQDSRRLFDGESQRQSPHRSGSPVGRPARPPHRLHAGPQ